MGVCKSCGAKDVYAPRHLHGGQVMPFGSSNLLSPDHRFISRTVKTKHPLVDSRQSSQVTLEFERGRQLEHSLTDSDRALLFNTLQGHFILKNLEEASLYHIIQSMKLFQFLANETIIEQGEQGYHFFVLASGSIEVWVDSEKLRVLHAPTAFGELALLDDSPRTATITAAEVSEVWVVSKKTFESAVKRANELVYEENKRFVDSVELFQALTPDQREDMLNYMTSELREAGEVVIREGDSASFLYIVKEGQLKVTQRGTELRTIGAGDVFGEQSFLKQSVRTATVTALTQTKLLSVSHENLIECFGESYEQVIYRNSVKIALTQNSLLQHLTAEQLEEILKTMQIKVFKSGQIIVPYKTEVGNYLWIVLKGKIQPDISENGTLGNQGFETPGEATYSEDVLAVTKCAIAIFSREAIQSALGVNLNVLKVFNSVIHAMQSLPLLKPVPLSLLRTMAKSSTEVTFESQSELYSQGSTASSFYIVITGEVQLHMSGATPDTLTGPAIIGTEPLLRRSVRDHTATAATQLTCWEVNLQEIGIPELLQKQLAKRIALMDTSLPITDLVVVTKLGSGMFGEVYLCAHRTNRTLYAFKAVSRTAIQQYHQEERLYLEESILKSLDHPMVMKLVRTYEETQYVGLLSEYVDGMDMFDVERVLGVISEFGVQFYTASLVLIFEYLQSQAVVYRDLKPENVMVDHEGYPKLIDMGAATLIEGRTYTTIGTPHYMAPEVIVGHGYDFAADWWSLGVMVYEMFTGVLPFGHNCEDPVIVYNEVLSGNCEFLNRLESPALRECIELLLQPKTHRRARGNIKAMRDVVWFAQLDWQALLTRSMTPPFLPPAKDYIELVEQKCAEQDSLQEYLAGVYDKKLSPV